MCPGIALDVLGIELRLNVQVQVRLGARGMAVVVLDTVCGSGPPTPF
jgi:hypothetical protein